MSYKYFAALVAALALSSPAQGADRSAEADQLMEYFEDIYGEKIIAGTMANVNWNTNEAQWVHRHTGRWVAFNTFDFIQDVYSRPGAWVDYSNASVVLNWHRDGGIVSAMWHWMMPTNDGKSYSYTPGTEAGQTSFSPACVNDPNSEGYKQIIARIDKVAQWLKPLADQGIPVLWRPLHEAQGNWTEKNPGTGWHKAWFWWGADGPEAFVQLWRLMHDRLTQHHGLDNLLWVFTAGDSKKWYPGDEYVDIVGCDLYNTNGAQAAATFNALSAQYPGKMVAMSECGNVGDIADIWEAGGKYLYFMPWYDYDRTNDPNGGAFTSTAHSSFDITRWQSAFGRSYVVTRDNLFDTEPVEPEQDKVIFVGSKNLGNWQDYIVFGPEVCADLEAGDRIAVDFSVNAGEGYGQMLIKSSTWSDMPTITATASNVNAYHCFDPGTIRTTYTVPQSDVAAVRQGFILTGEKVTVTKVTIPSRTGSGNEGDNEGDNSAIETITAANEAQPVEYYNLQGVRIAQPAPGTIVIRRQGDTVTKMKW